MREKLLTIKNKALREEVINYDEAFFLSTYVNKEELYEAAKEITLKKAAREFEMCSIINAKSGKCSEDCKWCAQSAHYKTKAEIYPLVDKEECLRHAQLNEQQGVERFSLVTSGKKPTKREVDIICETNRFMRTHSSISLCASLGLVDKEDLIKLYMKISNQYLTKYHMYLIMVQW